MPLFGSVPVALDDAQVALLPTIVGLTDGQAVNSADIATVRTQSSVVSKRGIGTARVNTTNVAQDLYSANTAQPWTNGDSYTLLSTTHALNTYPITDKLSTVSTTTGSATITQTGGTTFASTDTDRTFAAAGVPAGTRMTYVSATSATLKDSAGVAVSATATATGVAATISSPSFPLVVVSKFAGLNSISPPTMRLPAAGPGSTYIIISQLSVTAGVNSTSHFQELYLKVYNAVASGNASWAYDAVTDALNGKLLDGGQTATSTTTDYGVTQPAIELRMNSSAAYPLFSVQYMNRILMRTQAPS